MKMPKHPHPKHLHPKNDAKLFYLRLENKHLRLASFFIFSLAFGVFFLFFSITTLYAIYERQYENKAYHGVVVGDTNVSAKTKEEIIRIFDAKNAKFVLATFEILYENQIATVSASSIGLGYDSNLLATQAITIGRTGNIFADTYNKILAWQGEMHLPPSYTANKSKLAQVLKPFADTVTVVPVDAIFEMQGNRVVNFKPSIDGQTIDYEALKQAMLQHIDEIRESENTTTYFQLALPITTAKPAVVLFDANTFGIKELIGQGTSRFMGSIPNRVFNIGLAASRIDGIIIQSGETFSFNKTVGDISKATGYKEAYIIKNGRTQLDDGGGVCQVSTTIFRAALNAGLPIVERYAHAYRVSYYEQDANPGLDATVFYPTYDFKFKNDTPAAILIKASFDEVNKTLAFNLYGMHDGRLATISKSTITKQIPAPEDKYEDDPTLPKGEIKQVDFKAAGASVTFSYTVYRGEEELLAKSFVSNYRPWQAVFLRGTKE